MTLFGNQFGIIPAREITIKFSSARPTSLIIMRVDPGLELGKVTTASDRQRCHAMMA
jgi:hypothetical protein